MIIKATSPDGKKYIMAEISPEEVKVCTHASAEKCYIDNDAVRKAKEIHLAMEGLWHRGWKVEVN